MSGIFDQVINYAPPSLLKGTVTYKGTWSAATNTPTLINPPDSTTNGFYYVVSAGGTQFSLVFNIGDWIISNGSAWEKVDNTDAVSSVFGRTGAVVGVSTDYSAVGITNTALGASNPSTVAATTVTATSTIAATGAVTGSNLSGTNTGDQTITLTGGVTGSGTGSFAATVVTNANLTGDVTSSGNATTLTNAPVIAKVLTGYTSGAGTVAATDSILQAIQKLNGNDGTNANLTGVITSVGNATSIASQTGTGSTFVVSGSPTITTPVIAQINDASGNETLKLASIASAVNEVTIENAATGNAVHITATGGDASVGLHLAGKGASGYVNVQDSTDATKRIMFNAAGGTTNTRTMLSSTQTVDRTLSLPDATDTLVGKATTDTLTNKTLTSPTITGGALNGTLGATTPSTVAATTISATTSMSVINASGQANSILDATSADAVLRYKIGGVEKATIRVNNADQNLIFEVGASERAKVTSTGLNSTAIGATTVSTGAFSTLGATSLTTIASSVFVTSRSVPASGAGLEMYYQANASGILSYDRTGSAYKPLSFDATTTTFNSSGSSVVVFSSTGAAITGTLSATGAISTTVGSTTSVLTGSGGTTIVGNTGAGSTQIYVANAVNTTFAAGGITMGVGLAVTGAITATGNITAYYSDDRLKTKLGNIENALDKVCSLDGFYYEANETAQALGYKPVREVGLSAQSVQKVLPEVIAPAPIDSQYLTMHYERVVPLLVEAIKELRAEVASLKKCNC